MTKPWERDWSGSTPAAPPPIVTQPGVKPWERQWNGAEAEPEPGVMAPSAAAPRAPLLFEQQNPVKKPVGFQPPAPLRTDGPVEKVTPQLADVFLAEDRAQQENARTAEIYQDSFAMSPLAAGARFVQGKVDPSIAPSIAGEEQARRFLHEANTNPFWEGDASLADKSLRGFKDVVAALAGGASGDPTVLLSPGKTAVQRIASQAAIQGASDAAAQGFDVGADIQEGYDVGRGALAVGSGAVLQGLFEIPGLAGWLKNQGLETLDSVSVRAAADPSWFGQLRNEMRAQGYDFTPEGQVQRYRPPEKPVSAVEDPALQQSRLAEVFQNKAEREADKARFGEYPEPLPNLRQKAGESEADYLARRQAAAAKLSPKKQAQIQTAVTQKENEHRAQVKRQDETLGRGAPPASAETPPIATLPDVYSTPDGRAVVISGADGANLRVRPWDVEGGRIDAAAPEETYAPDTLRLRVKGGGYAGTAGAEAGRGAAEGARVAQQEQVRGAFSLAERQRQRDTSPDPKTFDTQPAGRPEGVAPQDVLVHEGFPVRVVGQGENGTVLVQRYDPRTGEAVAGSIPYNAPAARIEQRAYSPEPRRSQDFVDRAEGPPAPELPRMPNEGVSREPNQTFRRTAPDPSATGPGRETRPPQPEGPYPGPSEPRAETYQRARNEEELKARFRKGQYRASDEAKAQAEAKYSGGKAFSSKAKAPREDGSYELDEFDFALSDKGGPLKFKTQVQAAKWILNAGNKGPQNFEIANHPSGNGFAVRNIGDAGGAKSAPASGKALPGNVSPRPQPKPPEAPAPEPAPAPKPESGEGGAAAPVPEPLAADKPQAPVYRAGIEGADQWIREIDDELAQLDRFKELRPEEQARKELLGRSRAQAEQYRAEQVAKSQATPEQTPAPSQAKTEQTPAPSQAKTELRGTLSASFGRNAASVVRDLQTPKFDGPDVPLGKRAPEPAPTKDPDVPLLKPGESVENAITPENAQRHTPKPKVEGKAEPQRIAVDADKKPRVSEDGFVLNDKGAPAVYRSEAEASFELGKVKGLDKEGQYTVSRIGELDRWRIERAEPEAAAIPREQRVEPDDAPAPTEPRETNIGKDVFIENTKEILREEPRTTAQIIDALEDQLDTLRKDTNKMRNEVKRLESKEPQPKADDARAQALRDLIVKNAVLIKETKREIMEARVRDNNSTMGMNRIFDPGPGKRRANTPSDKDEILKAAAEVDTWAELFARFPKQDPQRIRSIASDAGFRSGAPAAQAKDRLAKSKLGPLSLKSVNPILHKEFTKGELSANALAEKYQVSAEAVRRQKVLFESGAPVDDAPVAADLRSKFYSNPADPKAYKDLLLTPAGRAAKKAWKAALDADPNRAEVWDMAARGVKNTTVKGLARSVNSLGQAILGSDIGALRMYDRRYPNLTATKNWENIVGKDYVGRNLLSWVADQFGTDPGSGKKMAQAFEPASRQRFNQKSNALDNILKGLNEADRVHVKNVMLGQEKPRDAEFKARAMRLKQWLVDQRQYMLNAGVTLGEVRNYFHRIFDPEAILANKDTFLKKAAEEYRRNGSNDPNAEALALFNNIVFPMSKQTQHFAMFANPNPTKGRVFGASADKNLAEFYIQDPKVALTKYAEMTSRMAEYTRRFGQKSEKLMEVLDTIRKEMSPQDFELYQGHVWGAAGVNVMGAPPNPLRELTSWVQVLGVAKLLSRTAVAQLTEPVNIAMRMNTKNPLTPYLLMFKQFEYYGNWTKESKDAHRLAEAVGVLGESARASMIDSRLNGLTGAMQQRLTHNFFNAIGTQYMTEHQRVLAMKMGGIAIKAALEDAVDGKSGARLLLGEYGIDLKDAKPMLDWLAKVDKLPPGEKEARIGWGDDTFAKTYRAALYDFATRSILEPTAAMTPTMAKHPLTQQIYAITSFSYAFAREMRNRVFKQARFATADGYAAVSPLITFMSAYIPVALLINQTLRNAVFSSKATEDQDDVGAFTQALSVTGLTGSMDRFVNLLIEGARYQSDPAAMAAGPYLSSAIRDGMDVMGVFTNANNPGTNTQEWNAVKAAYSGAAAPMLALLAAQAPLPPVARIGAGVATAFGTSSDAGRGVADTIAGPKASAKKAATSDDYGSDYGDDYGSDYGSDYAQP